MRLFEAGIALAQRAAIGALRQVYFIAPAWMSVPKPGKLLTVRPSQDPQRKAVLVISGLQVEQCETQLVVLEMRYDAKDKLTGLKPVETIAQQQGYAQSPLLDAFVHGFRRGAASKLH